MQAMIKKSRKNHLTKVLMIMFYDSYINPLNNAIIFIVQLINNCPVYMSADRSLQNSKRTIVMVESNKLLELWRNDPLTRHAEIAYGNPESWCKDYKYHNAEQGFLAGKDNPVPLAEISYQELSEAYHKKRVTSRLFQQNPKKISCISFTNGITRTIWLLSNGASHFPVELYDFSEAEKLANIMQTEIYKI